MQLNRLGEHIGAEIVGIDLTQPITEAERAQLNAAVVEHVALVIRDQHFTPQQFLTAAAYFGEPMAQHYTEFAVPGLPLVNEICNQHKDKNGQRVNHGESWHTDHPNHRIPPKYTTLYGIAIPDQGGDTEILNTRAGYESLPTALKKRIRHMQTANVFLGSATLHPFSYAANAQKERQPDPVLQPLVRTNPENGSQALYFSTTKCEAIVGITPEQTQELLTELLEQIVKPEFIYKHQWRVGDMLIWDNRSAMHQGVIDCDPQQLRLLHRVIIKGELPF